MNQMLKYDDVFYNIKNDLEAYPDYWAFLVVGGRGTGKTYSTLTYCLDSHIPFAFVKRTYEEVDLLCAGSGSLKNSKSEYGMDFSPFKSINKDRGTNIKPFKVTKGIGGFWHCDEEGQPYGTPIGTIVSLKSGRDIKGMDLTDVNMLIFDEFIPQTYQRTERTEGEMLMEIYETINRAREIKGRPSLKLVCLANAVNINNRVMDTLEVIDDMAELQLQETAEAAIASRGIFIRKLKNSVEFDNIRSSTMVYQAMADTAWGQMAYGNSFANNDFTNVKRLSLKNFSPCCSLIYKHKTYYIYSKDGFFYITGARHQSPEVYDLKKENDQKKFFYNYVYDIKSACIDDKAKFSSYVMYDLIMNYRDHFKV